MVTPIETGENSLSNDGKFKWVHSRGDESDFFAKLGSKIGQNGSFFEDYSRF